MGTRTGASSATQVDVTECLDNTGLPSYIIEEQLAFASPSHLSLRLVTVERINDHNACAYKLFRVSRRRFQLVSLPDARHLDEQAQRGRRLL
jgi:hypothetical protein